jgi:DNA-binding winged helix-turn-helix (wHTH) protein
LAPVTSAPLPVTDSLNFDDVTIDFSAQRLTRSGIEQPLEPKAFAVLALLAKSPGRVFTRDEILDTVWGHRHVTQSVLNRIMSLLRQALGEDAQHPRRLRTVHGIGYRFDLPVTAAPAPTAEAKAVPARPRWHTFLAIGAAAVVMLGGLAWWVRHVDEKGPAKDRAAAAAPPSLAVLPFADLSESRDQQYLADGLAEDILHQLSQVPALRVVGRSSSFTFKNRNEDPRVMGQKLGVSHLLEGSVRKAGGTTPHLRAADSRG